MRPSYILTSPSNFADEFLLFYFFKNNNNNHLNGAKKAAATKAREPGAGRSGRIPTTPYCTVKLHIPSHRMHEFEPLKMLQSLRQSRAFTLPGAHVMVSALGTLASRFRRVILTTAYFSAGDDSMMIYLIRFERIRVFGSKDVEVNNEPRGLLVQLRLTFFHEPLKRYLELFKLFEMVVVISRVIRKVLCNCQWAGGQS